MTITYKIDIHLEYDADDIKSAGAVCDDILQDLLENKGFRRRVDHYPLSISGITINKDSIGNQSL